MEKKRLGKTDLFVSKICLGTMTWGEQNTKPEAFAQLDYALDADINFIDTAEIYAVPPKETTYTLTERYIGEWLAQRGCRDKIIVATKMAGFGLSWIRGGNGLIAEDIETAVDGSLQRLQTDVIDLYQLHWPQRKTPLWGQQNYHESMYNARNGEEMEKFFCRLAEVQRKGKVKHFGLSNETAWGVMQFQRIAEKHGLSPMVSIQNAYSILRRDFEVGLAEVALQESVGLLAYSPLAGGILSGKYREGRLPEGSRYQLFPELMGYYANDRTNQALAEYAQLADELKISLTELSLAFVNDRGFVTSNIIGATTMEQLKENIGSARIKLSEESYRRIDEIFAKIPNPGNY